MKVRDNDAGLFHIHYDEQTNSLVFFIDAPCTVDHVFTYYHVAKHLRYQFYQNGCVHLNDHIVKQNQCCQETDVLTILPLHTESAIVPWIQPLHICYEDPCFLIVDKPSGMLVHSDGVNQTHTLHNCVQAYYQANHIQSAVRSIHRLDRETSGLVLYCKMPFFQAYADHLLAEKQIERIYLAWVKGIIPEDTLVIDRPIGRDRHNAKRMRVHPSGKQAVTIITVKQRKKDACLVECRLKTGRTHQIRVHLASIHHPILADSLYGTMDQSMDRCALHAWKLRFYHPLYERIQEVVCPLPKDMKDL